MQKPACRWEFYIVTELQQRLANLNADIDVVSNYNIAETESVVFWISKCDAVSVGVAHSFHLSGNNPVDHTYNICVCKNYSLMSACVRLLYHVSVHEY